MPKIDKTTTLELSQTEVLVVYDSLKSLLRTIFTTPENVPLAVVFATVDLLKELTPTVNELAAQPKEEK